MVNLAVRSLLLQLIPVIKFFHPLYETIWDVNIDINILFDYKPRVDEQSAKPMK